MERQRTTIAVTGACGKVGLEMARAVLKTPNLKLIAAVDIKNLGRDIGELAGVGTNGIMVSECINIETWDELDVIIDFTYAKAAFGHIRDALLHGVSVVSGTTGLTQMQKDEIYALAKEKQTGAVIAPNFAIGALLMMRLSQELANWFADAEIIELHNPYKLDAPSGTAIQTAELIQDKWREQNIPLKMEELPVNPARGDCKKGISIHSIRLPGLVAHQEVIFGGLGQTISIRHDSYSRESFVPGVLLAVKKVVNLSEAIFGLEQLLFS
ncbi:MAG: 4-hydroxy-tetrahydrodipicolinate reductase [Bacillota bacterium]